MEVLRKVGDVKGDGGVMGDEHVEGDGSAEVL
jgi:hypothetical protein